MDPGAPLETPARCWALVTGGSRGIGRAVVEQLAGCGWSVAIAHLRNTAAAEESATAARARGAEVIVHTGNLGDPEECGRLAQRIWREAGPVSALVHCAGLGALAPALEARPGRWRMAWDTHVGALIELLRSDLVAPGGGVVALSSLGAHRVTRGYAPIAAAKGALETLVRYLAVEMAEKDIAVNAVCAGPIDTDSLRSFAFYDEVEEASQGSIAGRIGRPADIAPIVAFLVGPGARWIRGQVLVADGGFGLT